MEKFERIQHFGVWIKKSEKNKISRENYAVINKKSSIWSHRIAKIRKAMYKTDEDRKKEFDDEECRIYSDLFCDEWQEKCLINYDKNMKFFSQIPKEEFEKELTKVIEANKKLIAIHDLNQCKGMCGIYILVLDEFKQVYIGQAIDIKRRILQHWNKCKGFDRLLWGGVNRSVLSIDCFGALDITRIFVLNTNSLNYNERSLVEKLPDHLKLNRIGGGYTGEIDLLRVLSEWNLRPLEKCHSEQYAEKYEKEVDVTYFKLEEECDCSALSAGDIICIEDKKSVNNSIKIYGQIRKINKTRLYIYKYCGPTTDHFCYSSNCKKEISNIEEIRIKKDYAFSKVVMIEKREKHTFWRSKKFPHLEA